MEDEGITQLIIYKQADKTNDLFFFPLSCPSVIQFTKQEYIHHKQT